MDIFQIFLQHNKGLSTLQVKFMTKIEKQ